MRFTIRYREIAVGDVELPPAGFVAGHVTPAAEYATIRTIVRRSTEAFLHLGLFHDPSATGVARLPRMPAWRAALVDASRLQLRLVDMHHQAIATHFINLLEGPADDGVVALVSFRGGSSGRSVGSVRSDPSGLATASRVGLADEDSASENP